LELDNNITFGDKRLDIPETSSLTTFSIMALSIKGKRDILHNNTQHKGQKRHSASTALSLTMLCHYAKCHKAECCVLFFTILNVLMLNFVLYLLLC